MLYYNTYLSISVVCLNKLSIMNPILYSINILNFRELSFKGYVHNNLVSCTLYIIVPCTLYNDVETGKLI